MVTLTLSVTKKTQEVQITLTNSSTIFRGLDGSLAAKTRSHHFHSPLSLLGRYGAIARLFLNDGSLLLLSPHDDKLLRRFMLTLFQDLRSRSTNDGTDGVRASF